LLFSDKLTLDKNEQHTFLPVRTTTNQWPRAAKYRTY